MGAQRAEVHRLRDRQVRGSTKANRPRDSNHPQRTEAPEAQPHPIGLPAQPREAAPRTVPTAAGESALATAKFRVLPVVGIREPSQVQQTGPPVVPLEQAASAALPAWELPDAPVQDAVGRDAMSEGKHMNAKSAIIHRSKIYLAALTLLACATAGILRAGAPQAANNAAVKPPAQQRGFATAKQAADALVQAAKNYDLPALKEIFGPDGEDFVSTADPVQDKNHSERFAAKAGEKLEVVTDTKNPARATLVVGNEEWPTPVPIVRIAGKWYFDSKAGHDEILRRRIGADELDAIQICRGYVEAQLEYSSEAHDDSGVHQYAQRIVSTPGKHDGLAWREADGTWAGPVGEGVAKAIEQGYSERGEPFHGYFFKILKGQGPAAPLGELDFVIGGVMIGGFALAAAPAEYRITGVQTFIVSHDGIVYEKDLGPDSLTVFKRMDRYNPDKTWHRTTDNW